MRCCRLSSSPGVRLGLRCSLEKLTIRPPFDRQGKPLAPGKLFWYNVPAGLSARNNAVATVEQFFPGLPQQTAYLRIQSEGPVVGFGLSGDPTGDKLDALALSALPKW